MNFKVRLKDGTEVELPESEIRKGAAALGLGSGTTGTTTPPRQPETPLTLAETVTGAVLAALNAAGVIPARDNIHAADRLDLSFVRSERPVVNDDPLPTDDPFEAAVDRLMLSNPRLTYAQAGERVCRQHPEYWQTHREILAGTRLPKVLQANNRHILVD